MAPHTALNGAVVRNVLTGRLATGESVGVDETMQPAGTAPNPPHRIQHSEIIVIQQGAMKFDHEGKAERAGAGSILYVAYRPLHSAKNIGPGQAKYVVIQIGGNAGK